MQKKLIALAVAGLAALPAFAQSNVTIYGLVDMGYKWTGDNIDDRVANRSGIDSGMSAGSRIGFKGTEDLGNGLKAGFVLEQGILTDTGASSQGGRTFGRQSYVSLSGGFGTVALGRQYPAGYLLTATVDPFGSGTAGQYNSVYLTEYRWDNSVTYVSPTWSGFSVAASFTMNANYANESAGNRGAGDVGDIRAWSIVPQYSNGPFFVGLNLEEMRAKSTGAFDGERIRVYDLAGTYDFGVAKLAASYGLRRASAADFSPDTAAVDGKDTKQWFVGVTVPVSTAGTVRASYVHRKTEVAAGGADAKASQWALGYEHALSKRTSLYAVYADINNNRAARESTLFSSIGDAIAGGTVNGDGYQSGANLGVIHRF
ncbi:MAG: porin [Thauera sp.]|nr:porin [Thauera sp.]